MGNTSKLAKNKKISTDMISNLTLKEIRNIKIKDDNVMKKIESLCDAFDQSLSLLHDNFKDKVDKVQSGDDLLPGSRKLIKVFVANEKTISPR